MTEDRETALRLVPVSRETQARLDAYVALLLEWQARMNLVAASTLPHLWTRHIADSLQILPLLPHATRWLDIGSGGFPGIVLACVLAEKPGARIHLVERVAKKAAFLREALRVTGGAGIVQASNITDCAAILPPDIEVVTARAVAPLHTLLGLAEPWLARGAQGIFLKGQDVDAEIEKATISWDFNHQTVPSLTGPGTLVRITEWNGKRHIFRKPR